jgi:hypothetical protein
MSADATRLELHLRLVDCFAFTVGFMEQLAEFSSRRQPRLLLVAACGLAVR